MAAAGERIKRAGVGNCALALIEDGRIFDSYLHSVGAPIDDDTLFQILAHRLSAVARPQTGRNRWSFGAKSAQQEPA